MSYFPINEILSNLYLDFYKKNFKILLSIEMREYSYRISQLRHLDFDMSLNDLTLKETFNP